MEGPSVRSLKWLHGSRCRMSYVFWFLTSHAVEEPCGGQFRDVARVCESESCTILLILRPEACSSKLRLVCGSKILHILSADLHQSKKVGKPVVKSCRSTGISISSIPCSDHGWSAMQRLSPSGGLGICVCGNAFMTVWMCVFLYSALEVWSVPG